MSFNKSLGFLAASALASVIAQGCSSNASGPADAGTVQHKGDGGVIIATDDGGDGGDGGGLQFDGTSGKQCKTDADCSSPTGPGINKCSIDFMSVVTNVKTPFLALPTPVCLVPPSSSSTTGNCDPAPPSDASGALIHFCDGPDMPTSPSICVALTSPATPGLGACLPACSFALDGSAPTGCVGKDTCLPTTVGSDMNGNTMGLGFCQGSCQTNADCSGLGTGFVCQTDIGACTKTPVTRKKAVGAACAADPTKTVGNDNATGACNCLPDSTTNLGYCTTACIVGGNPCPNGWICDNLQPSEVQLPDGTLLAVAMENKGTPGVCMPPCSLDDAGTGIVFADSGGSTDAASAADGSRASDGGAAPDAGTVVGGQSCPAASVCEVVTPVGPDCVP